MAEWVLPYDNAIGKNTEKMSPINTPTHNLVSR